MATITSHRADVEVWEDEVYVMGEVSDADDTPEALLTSWTLGGTLACPEQPPDKDGRTRCLVKLTGGEVELSLQVVDPVGLRAEVVVDLTVLKNAPPTAQIHAPTGEESLYSDIGTPLLGTASDAEDDPVALKDRKH